MKKILFHFFSAILLAACGQSEETIDGGFGRITMYDYQPSELVFGPDENTDSIWSPKVASIFRDDTLRTVGNSLSELSSEPLHGNLIIYKTEWYEIVASNSEDGFMIIHVFPNNAPYERHETIVTWLYNRELNPPRTYGEITIRQEGIERP